MDRFVRDICSQRPSDWLLHVSDEQCVVEGPDADLLVPVAFKDLGGLVERGVLGRAAALHAHSTGAAVRQATRVLATGMGLRYVVTLHDVEFAGPAGSSPTERQERFEFIRTAASCTVPSHFMREVARQALGDSFECTVVENGIEPLAPASSAPGAERFPVAVIGALGKHKGLEFLVDVAACLPADTRIVLLGYADGQLGPGWLCEGRVWVHGAFEPTQLPSLVAEYGAALAFFPRGVPESYCYALSDAWLAGLPVLGPDIGAIGERVRAHGGGTLYDPAASAADVALALSRQLAQGEGGKANVEAAVKSLSPVATMVESMNAIYAAVAAAASPPDLETLKASALKHLDSRFFRRELLRLQGDLAAAGEQRDNALRELHSLAENHRQRGDWIEHLQRANESLQQDCASLEPLQLQLAGLQSEHQALAQSFDALNASHEKLVRRLTWPLCLLPAPAQSWIGRALKRMSWGKENNG